MNGFVEKLIKRLNDAESVKTFGSINSGNRLIPVSEAEKIINKFAKEQGHLFCLHCKAGQTVYFADNEFYLVVVPVKISEIIIGESDAVQYNGCLFDGNGDPVQDYEFDSEDFGKTVFITKEEAEFALYAIKEGAE